MAKNGKEDILIRLRKVEGQIRGLQRMIADGKDCSEVVHQLAAARKALDKVGFLILTHKMQECIEQRRESGEDKQQALDEALKLFLTLA